MNLRALIFARLIPLIKILNPAAPCVSIIFASPNQSRIMSNGGEILSPTESINHLENYATTQRAGSAALTRNRY